MNEIQFLSDGPVDAEIVFVFAHGAGAPMDSEFMNEVASLIARSGIRVERFEFAYMAARRQGSRRGPDRTDVLLKTWEHALEAARAGRKKAFIGGKSLGGRIASMLAVESEVDGVVCFGYPFHPPGKPENLRTAHLREMATPVLILQGERDPFGKPEEVAGYELSQKVQVVWIPDGDHSLRPRKRSGHTLEKNIRQAASEAVCFME